MEPRGHRDAGEDDQERVRPGERQQHRHSETCLERAGVVEEVAAVGAKDGEGIEEGVGSGEDPQPYDEIERADDHCCRAHDRNEQPGPPSRGSIVPSNHVGHRRETIVIIR